MKISVITPFYNTLSTLSMTWLERFCGNLNGQTGLKNFRRHIEHVWIDDGSSDGTHDTLLELARRFSCLNVTVLKSATNEGPSVARNRAIERASGKWIAYADSDDLLADDREAHIRSIVSTDRDLYFAPYYIRDSAGSCVYDVRAVLAQQIRKLSLLVESTNPSIPLGVCHTKELWRKAGGFPPHVVCGEDGILWRRMINRCGARVGFLDGVAGIYMVRSEGQSRTRRHFETGCAFEFDSYHPKGANGQYLGEHTGSGVFPNPSASSEA